MHPGESHLLHSLSKHGHFFGSRMQSVHPGQGLVPQALPRQGHSFSSVHSLHPA